MKSQFARKSKKDKQKKKEEEWKPGSAYKTKLIEKDRKKIKKVNESTKENIIVDPMEQERVFLQKKRKAEIQLKLTLKKLKKRGRTHELRCREGSNQS